MEYYEAIGDHRYIYFQRKMNTLMMNPIVLDTMEKDQEKKEKDKN